MRVLAVASVCRPALHSRFRPARDAAAAHRPDQGSATCLRPKWPTRSPSFPKDRANSSVRVFTLAPYNVNIEHRQPMAQGASVHAETSELFYVLEGSATMLTGGKLVGDPAKTIEGGVVAEVRQGRLADGAVRRQPSIHRHQESDHDSFAASAEREVGGRTARR